MIRLFLGLCFMLTSIARADEAWLKDKQRILVLGDSITQAGHYVADFDAWLVKRYPERRIAVINAGVSSETVSGLSEPGHAGGRFPRPDLHERLERVLTAAKPDLIIACYGMNCGIYQPLDEQRFQAYRDGTLRLRKAAAAHGADIVHVTPPIFDSHGKPGFDYDEVLTAYSKWLVDQRAQGWRVIDLHTAMRTKVDQARQGNPKFTLQGDHIHPNRDGHWLMAQNLIAAFGDEASAALASPDLLLGKTQRDAILARVTHYQKAIHAETKPKRPGVPAGGTLESAAAEAKALEGVIYGR
ncbi:MAG TPA: SGNH/GDSL hydrolase family protein [Luteolibacter sp.]|nr:SGNH/GDSL hydrolase family protein [Luteolibacter sp.]